MEGVRQGYEVKYSVVGFKDERSVGPFYNILQAEEELRDIAGYEGVFGARISLVKEEEDNAQ